MTPLKRLGAFSSRWEIWWILINGVILYAVSELFGRTGHIDPKARNGGVTTKDRHLVDHDHALSAKVKGFVTSARGGNTRTHDDHVKRFVPLNVLRCWNVRVGRGHACKTETTECSNY